MEINQKKHRQKWVAIAILILLLIAMLVSCSLTKQNNQQPPIASDTVTSDTIDKTIYPIIKIEDNAVKKEIVYSVVVVPPIVGGVVSVDVTSAKSDDIIAVKAEPQPSYVLETISVDNIEIKGTTFKMPEKNVKVTARFRMHSAEEEEIPQYILEKKDCSNGSFELNKKIAPEGELIEVLVTPNVGYALDCIIVNGVKLGEKQNSFRMPSKIVTVEVIFKKLIFTVTQENSVNGLFSVDKFTASIDEEIAITTAPDVGYEVDTITATNATIENNTATSQGTGDVAIIVTFKKIEWRVIKETTVNGSFSIDKTDVSIGDEIIVTAVPNVGYEIEMITATKANLQGNIVTSDGTGDIKIIVTFKKIVWGVIKEDAINGSFSVDKTSSSIGDEIVIIVTPDIGYTLDTITVTNATILGNVATVDGTGKVKITVTFKKLVWQATKETTTNGSFTLDKTTATIGDVIAIDIIPDTGYTLDTITATNATVEGNTVTSIGTGDIAITVTFKKLVWQATKEPATNGSFTLDKTTATIGDVIAVTAIPNIGYILDTITATNATVDGNTVTSIGTGDIAITVTFKKLVWQATKEPATNGSFTLDKTSVSIGDVITVTATANTGYMMDSIAATNATVNGNTVTASGKGNIKITVTFKSATISIYNRGTVGSNLISGWFFPGKLSNMGGIENRSALMRAADMQFYWWSNDGHTFIYTKEPIDFTNIKSISVNASNNQVYEVEDVWNDLRFELTKNTVDRYGAINLISYPKLTGGVKTANTTAIKGDYYMRIMVYGAVSAYVHNVEVTYEDGTVLATSASATSLPVETSAIEDKIINEKTQRNIKRLPTTNGEFSIKSTAAVDEKVIISVTPYVGYRLEYIKVNGAVIVGTTFIMPEEDVEVEVMFKKIS